MSMLGVAGGFSAGSSWEGRLLSESIPKYIKKDGLVPYN